MPTWPSIAAHALTATRRTFGQSVTYNGVTIRAVFDPAAVLIEPDRSTLAAVRTTAPMLWVDHAALGADPAPGDVAVIDGAAWQVIDIEPDGAGGYACRLHRA